MIIAAISDLHGYVPAPSVQVDIDRADVVCICGDVESRAADTLVWINEQKKPVVLTPGNHDRFFSEADARSYNWGLKPHVRVLIDEGCEIDGVRFWGTPWSPIFFDWAFMLPSEGLREKFAKIPEGIDMLITHGPPSIPRASIDMIEGKKEHIGSKELYEAVKRAQPRYHFCGHIHTGDHGCSRIGRTECFNVSYLNEQYEPTYGAKLVEV